MLLFNVSLEEKGGRERKEFNNVQLWRLRKGSKEGGVRVQTEDQVYGCVELSAAQA
jgi:hypothetical protein